MTVSIIMPARDAAGTIGEAVDSLVAQEWADWRLIIVDDGSSDDTRVIAERYAVQDQRIMVIDGPRRGAGAARNAGLAALREEWVLFFDADDLLGPTMLRRMMETLAAHPQADAAHCGWNYIDWQGNFLFRDRCEVEGPDLFPILARYCAFIIHTCLFRRALYDRVGAIEERFATSEDFDLWQRIARLGAHFVPVPEYLATYRVRPTQTWFDAVRFLPDVLRVVERGHARDPRLDPADVPPGNLEGMPIAALHAARANMVVWAAGGNIVRGIDPRALLEWLPAGHPPVLDAGQLAETLLSAMRLVACRPPSALADLWPAIRSWLALFLDALETRSGIPGLAERVVGALEVRIAIEAQPLLSEKRAILHFNVTAAVYLEVEGELAELKLSGCERTVCHVHNLGRYFGWLVLPVIDGRLARCVLRDAIAARFAWPLLNSLFTGQVYWRFDEARANEEDARRLAGLLAETDAAVDRLELHDRIGWGVFVQELTGLHSWNIAQLYDPGVAHPQERQRQATGSRERIEFSMPMPTLVAVPGETLIDITLGGADAVTIALQPHERTISAARIRAAALDRGKMELARVAVREAMVGYHGDNDLSLRARLAALAEANGAWPPEPGSVGANKPRVATPLAADLPTTGARIIGAPPGFAPTQEARRCELPASLARTVVDSRRAGQRTLMLGEEPQARVFVYPDLIATPPEIADVNNQPTSSDRGPSALYGRHFFERSFSHGADPWHYASAYEQRKYEQTLGVLPLGNRRRVLEVGCAEGHFTVQLAPLVHRLIATDIADLALERAAVRCKASTNITYAQLDVLADPLAGAFDAIFCSELLYYMGDVDDLHGVGAKLAQALRPSGVLIAAHANLVVDDPHATGFDWRMPYGAKRIGETLALLPNLVFECEMMTPLYRIQRFRRCNWRDHLLPSRTQAGQPNKREHVDFAQPQPHVARHILWHGGKVVPDTRSVTTDRLPILMYHAVSDAGPDALARWRVTPALFDAQIRYLRDAGFAPASFDEWHRARAKGEPLPGRRVLITFDDVYADFGNDALAILTRYGFEATLFVPSDSIGRRAEWDAWSGTTLPLLDLEGLRSARDTGMQIGSHGASHRHFTGLAPAAIADDLWRSRTTLEQALEIEVNALAYPSGSYDEVTERIAASAFYRHGVTVHDKPSGLTEGDFTLSRIEVRGGETLADFIARLPE